MIDIGIDKDGHSLRLLIAQALRSYPTTGLYPLLEDKSVPVRTAAARELQMRGEAETFEYAVALLSDNRAYVREIGIFTLGQFRSPLYPYKNESTTLISDRLSKDKSSAVRAAAAAALGHLKAHDALDFLIVAAKDRSAQVRTCVAFALVGMKRHSRAREALRTLKRDFDDEVCFWADE